jgi:DNA protecting protein DprA
MKYPIHVLTNRDSKSKPGESIWTVTDAPQTLYVQGNEDALALLEQLPQKGLGIVGTRNPQTRSIDLAQKIISQLAHSDLIIISGLARGIDTVAHWAALDAGLPTIAVLGAGLDLNYPAENQTLREKILKTGGLLVSEFPIRTPALAHHFLRRNRLIAGWSHATWVVEAATRSGALNTAKWAREMNRLCFAVPCFPNDPSLAGNQTLLDRDHAIALWGVHSLGAAWIELATKSHRLVKTPQNNPSCHRISSLISHVNALTCQNGGASLDEVFAWAVSQDWKSEEFFDALQSAIRGQFLTEQCGFLKNRQ